jgi:hypothetical protein
MFLPIQNDPALIVPNRGVDVFVASGTLQKGYDWASIVTTAHQWLRDRVRTLPVGEFNHVVGSAGTSQFRLLTRVEKIPDYDGDFHIGIDGSQLPAGTLGAVVEKALQTKVPKLAGTKADDRILLLERDEFTLSEDQIAKEIESKRHAIAQWNQISEVWFADTVLYLSSAYVRFSMRDNGRAVKVLAFHRGRLHKRFGS